MRNQLKKYFKAGGKKKILIWEPTIRTKSDCRISNIDGIFYKNQ